MNFHKLPETTLNALYTAMESKKKEPSFVKAINSSNTAKWKHTCEDEIKQQLHNRTWEVITYKKGMHLLPLK